MNNHQFDWSHLALGSRNLSFFWGVLTYCQVLPRAIIGLLWLLVLRHVFKLETENFENRTGVENGAHSRCKNLLNSPSDVKHLIDTILKQLFQAVSCILCYENLRD